MDIDTLTDNQQRIVAILLEAEEALHEWRDTLEPRHDDSVLVATGKGHALEAVGAADEALFQAWNVTRSYLDDPVGSAALAIRDQRKAALLGGSASSSKVGGWIARP